MTQNRFIARNVRAIPRSGIRDFFDIVQGMKDVISLGVGEPDFVTPWHIREAAIYALEQGRTPTLPISACSNCARPSPQASRRISRPPTTRKAKSSSPSASARRWTSAFRALLNPGDEVIYHEPCYVSYSPGIALAHGVPVAVSCRAEDGFSVTAEAIERVITPRSKVAGVEFPHQPDRRHDGPRGTGKDRRRRAARHNLMVMTDEIYSELTFEGEHVSIASLPGMKERTIFLHGFSKAYAMTGFRIGYACGPAEIIEAMMRIHQYSMLCASIISQEAALEAIQHGEADTAEMREQYRLRAQFHRQRLQ